ncbi:MAG TPA: hypothetical protein VFD60_04975 [Nitrososphaeraceae archaeon]|nr:hypothetical protein [Nitrososphaeraceae archaeon]
MNIPRYLMARSVDFIGKPSKMGNKLIIIVPADFHKDFEKLHGKFMKFHGEEILDK